jgi:hypothetical protein
MNRIKFHKRILLKVTRFSGICFERLPSKGKSIFVKIKIPGYKNKPGISSIEI